MPNLRDRIRMSDEEVWRFLEEAHHLQVATIGRDGSPHLMTLWFASTGRALVFPSYTKSQKIVNLGRDPRIAVLAEAGSRYEELRGVSINGRAELIDADPRRIELSQRIYRRYYPQMSEAQLHEMAERGSRKRTMVLVHPERTRSWDHRKIHATPRHGAGAARAENRSSSAS